MNDALYIAATGLQSYKSQLDAVANNVVNANTAAFKRARVSFGDLVGAVAAAPSNAEPGETASSATGRGVGVRVMSSVREFAPGELRRVDRPLALAIDGAGFIEVQLPDGSTAYSRGGTLELTADRMLGTAQGLPLKARIQVPEDARELLIATDGQVSATDERGRSWALGRIDVAVFASPTGLLPMGDNLYRTADGTAEPLVATPGDPAAGAGRLLQGYEEASNVKAVDELVQMMVAQRAYEMSVRVLQAADEVASLTNNLRRS